MCRLLFRIKCLPSPHAVRRRCLFTICTDIELDDVFIFFLRSVIFTTCDPTHRQLLRERANVLRATKNHVHSLPCIVSKWTKRQLLAWNYCCSLSLAEMVQVSPLCRHLHCSWFHCEITTHSLFSASTSLFLAVTGAAFTGAGLSIFVAALSFWEWYLVFRLLT